MGTGYTRNDTSNNIADGNIINAADLDGEFDAVESAFNSSTGHTHDGTAAEGGAITVVGPVQDLVVSATEVKPKTTNTLDLGTSALLYKDAYLQGNMYFRDTALKIVSSADGQLDIDADVELELVAPTVDIDASTALTVDTASTTFTSTLFNVTGSANITGDLDVDNININGNTIISTDTNGAINITPNGTGAVNITATTNITGDLDVDNININGNTISSTDTNGNITLAPNGTGVVALSSTDLTFGDNDKLIFGAGSDLEIYHDSATGNSIINELGTGSLQLRGTNIQLKNSDNTKNYIAMNDGGDVDLYYDNAIKLSTTNTGIDVTGTATMDGLTVNKDSGTDHIEVTNGTAGSDASPQFMDLTFTGFSNRDMARVRGVNRNSSRQGGSLQFETSDANSTDGSTYKTRLFIDTDGDISFYDDTGVTQGFFWDASTQRLGIGTTSPSSKLHVNHVNTLVSSADIYQTAVNIDNTDTGGRQWGLHSTGSSNGAGRFRIYDYDANVERMTIDTSGNVGIGTDSPNNQLEIKSDTATVVARLACNTGSGRDWGLASATDGIFGIYDYDASSYRMIIDSSGNVGIGTSPERDLHVKGKSGDPVHFKLEGDPADYARIMFDDGTTDNIGELRYNFGSDYMSFNTNSSERMRIDSSGRLGVNFTPTGSNAKVFIGGGSARTAASDTADEGIVLVPSASLSTNGYTPYLTFTPNASNPNRARAAIGAVSTNGTAALDLVFATRNAADGTAITGNDEKVRITSSGNVGIGVSDPSQDIDLVGSSNAGSGSVRAGGTGSGTQAAFIVQAQFGSAAFGTYSSYPAILDSSNNPVVYFDTNNGGRAVFDEGVTFNGDTAAANVLDDYETGNYQPTLSSTGGGTVSAVSTLDTLSYTKVGRFVHIQGNLHNLTISGVSGDLDVTLPFVAGGGTERSDWAAGFVMITEALTTSDNFPSGALILPYFLDGGDSYIRISGGADQLNTSNQSDLRLSFQYITSA